MEAKYHVCLSLYQITPVLNCVLSLEVQVVNKRNYWDIQSCRYVHCL